MFSKVLNFLEAACYHVILIHPRNISDSLSASVRDKRSWDDFLGIQESTYSSSSDSPLKADSLFSFSSASSFKSDDISANTLNNPLASPLPQGYPITFCSERFLPLLREMKRIQHKEKNLFERAVGKADLGNAKVTAISLESVRKCGFWLVATAIDFAIKMNLIEHSDELGTQVMLTERGYLIRDHYRGVKLDDLMTFTVPVLELFPSKFRPIVYIFNLDFGHDSRFL